jgi:hypothetical protein
MTDTPKPQPDKFRDLARQLECDEDEKAFEEKVRKVAEAPALSAPSKPKSA